MKRSSGLGQRDTEERLHPHHVIRCGGNRRIAALDLAKQVGLPALVAIVFNEILNIHQVFTRCSM